MRKTLFAAAAAAAVILFAPVASATALVPMDDTDSGYTPDEPTDPTLAGSTAVGECDGDVPWISYAVEMTDPDDQSTGNFARLILTDTTNSANTTTIDLGELVDGELSGRILWPGASVDAQGNPTGWPGWAFENGQWVETDGNFAWTRGSIDARIEVNPELDVALSYPPATPVCVTGPRDPGEDPEGNLPATGLSASMLPVAAVGGVLALAGAGVILARRRRAQR
ncbi:LPXTG-motif cell wall-anchored protein [Microbacterium terrae]|uniref:Gram-positive cocci surface proteins LPxTG domain-containing protein n=1 Tax=Microbacterium terrae TaxID=69369 RepID=A0A0M2H1F7_9MICO|nr:LPXTG cell wall anchor domain-containing protein [Microbacterium terrae]KJL37898.1 hypothetical protein RS81_02889 [Microbacterium terrae]MBP1077307.1 LPXTG-motif cell wall-anchored protein [Microbacterium terrae]GLJ98918.1 hypothetical protein GCM10017594_21150 [Microbacterium terrae]